MKIYKWSILIGHLHIFGYVRYNRRNFSFPFFNFQFTELFVGGTQFTCITFGIGCFNVFDVDYFMEVEA